MATQTAPGANDIAVSQVGGRMILSPAGSLTHENIAQLQAAFDRAVCDGKGDVVVDFKRVELVDSEALQTFLGMHEQLDRGGRQLKFIGMNDVCRDILIVTRLRNVLHAYEDLHAAVRGTQLP